MVEENRRLSLELEELRRKMTMGTQNRGRSARRGNDRMGKSSSRHPQQTVGRGKTPAPTQTNQEVQHPLGVWEKGQTSKVNPEKKTYASVTNVAGNRGSIPRRPALMKLQYVETFKKDGKVVVKPPVGVGEKEYKDWDCTLVGQHLIYLTVNAIARRLWGADGLINVLSSSN